MNPSEPAPPRRLRVLYLAAESPTERVRQIDAYPEADAVHAERPRTRGDCAEGPRPCPWVGCRHHLYLETRPGVAAIAMNFPELEPHEMRESCSLDVAERGGETLDGIAGALNVNRERVHQVEAVALSKLRRSHARRTSALYAEVVGMGQRVDPWALLGDGVDGEG